MVTIARVQQLVNEAAELPATDRVALAEAIDSLLHRDETLVLDSFKRAVESVAGMPLSRPEHPDIPGARWVLLARFTAGGATSVVLP